MATVDAIAAGVGSIVTRAGSATLSAAATWVAVPSTALPLAPGVGWPQWIRTTAPRIRMAARHALFIALPQ